MQAKNNIVLQTTDIVECETPMQIETLPLTEEASFSDWQQEIPKKYFDLSAEEISSRIKEYKSKMSNDLIILDHHYQREDIIQFADRIGDSYALSVYASENKKTPYIIFCGVHFMAEAADILTNDEQTVILPNLEAGCSMADMANRPDVSSAWKELKDKFPNIKEPKKDDICYATTNRQAAVKKISKECDMFFVIGSRNSSNSKRLVEVAINSGCKNSRLMHSDEKIPFDEILNCKTIGVSSGASAPEILVEKFINDIKEKVNIKINEVEMIKENVYFKIPGKLSISK